MKRGFINSYCILHNLLTTNSVTIQLTSSFYGACKAAHIFINKALLFYVVTEQGDARFYG